jgi:U4/U6.U5 tri-snRNP-associated protein 2
MPPAKRARADGEDAAPPDDRQHELPAPLQDALKAAVQGSAASAPSSSSGGGGRSIRRRPWEEEGFRCPYLDTINRTLLDFDFEKACSVTGNNYNVYACLVCGKYFQGRGCHTQAYTHSLQEDHHVFKNLHDGRVYCLPDGYEVVDQSLQDIQNLLFPEYDKETVSTLDTKPVYSRGVDGSDYMPGLIGLNNIKNTDYVNVVVQSLSRVPPVRDFFLLPENYAHVKSQLVQEFGALLRKMWSPYNFKGQVSPHELLQAVAHESDNRFKIGTQTDPMDFLAWLLNALHSGLGGTRKPGSSIIHKAFQGQVQIKTYKAARAETDEEQEVETKMTPFLYLTVDVPPAPLFRDALERNIIPQVPLFACLTKFDGATFQEMMNGDRRQYVITRLPRYLIIHIKRFSKNTQQYIEKNPTIVNFPVRNLDLAAYTELSDEDKEKVPTKYHLMSSTQHDGQPDSGTYRTYVHFKANDQWYDIQDLHVNGVHPQLISVSESYIQFYDSSTT